MEAPIACVRESAKYSVSFGWALATAISYTTNDSIL